MLLLVFPQLFSPLGNALVLAVAGVVCVFGAWQLWAAGRAHRIGESGEYRHCIAVWWELTPKRKLLAPVILPLLAFQADRDFPKIIQRMAAAALGENSAGQIRSHGGVFARLLPSFC